MGDAPGDEDQIPWEILDPEVIDLVRAMNAIPGVTTHFSCSGHDQAPDDENWAPGGYVAFTVDSLATLERVAEAVWHGPQDVLDVSHNVPLGRAMYCLRWGDFEATHEDRVRVIADLKARLSLLA